MSYNVQQSGDNSTWRDVYVNIPCLTESIDRASSLAKTFHSGTIIHRVVENSNQHEMYRTGFISDLIKEKQNPRYMIYSLWITTGKWERFDGCSNIKQAKLIFKERIKKWPDISHKLTDNDQIIDNYKPSPE